MSKSVEDYDYDYDIWNEKSLPTTVPREEWGALPPKAPIPPNFKEPKYVLFNYNTGGEQCTTKEGCIRRLKELQKFHMDVLGFDDIGFSFIIGGDGNIYEGRGWAGATPEELNMPQYYKNKIEIAWIGDYINSYELPPRPAGLAYKLLKFGTDKNVLWDDYELYSILDKAPTSREEIEEKLKTTPMALF